MKKLEKRNCFDGEHEVNNQSNLLNWQETSIFQGLNANELATLGKEAWIKTYKAGVALLSTESNSSVVYILLSGRVKIFVKERHGYNVTLAYCDGGALLGEISTIDAQKPSANVVTVKPCSLLVIPQDHFLWCWKHMPALSFNIAQVSATRIRHATAQIATLSTMNARCRIARQLRALASWEHDSREHDSREHEVQGFSKGHGILPTKLTQQELAEMVGCSREQVNRVMKQFVNEGLVAKNNAKMWVILKGQELDKYCQ